ncbi:BTAD domain-containing putative transcriptional regulator [Amycolatopsis cihanbeyliensis]|uniref:DNA-binding SARP family transcriptional activator n=1 Tax=Amycolatopsis cihanbeyliensis TaxID=1128664 RepID=A0A542DD24_AMYCI|nr:BTAD domain-containing putative transcriptional regulator [Amycolatopsis cihanbeyliensis]TQJ00968.1 DNA-binding SARP family transcriptional activator [Amycolatopsis cihanbeyliensis]
MALTTFDHDSRTEALTARERDVLQAVGRGLTVAEAATELAMSEVSVEGHLRGILLRLGLAVTPSAPPAPGPPLRLRVLGPLRAWRGEVPLNLGPVRQQALLAALVLRRDVTVSRRELLDGVWGMEPPVANVVPVYVYRLRTCLGAGDGRRDSVIGSDRGGYRFAGGGVWLDSTRVEEIAAEAGAAKRAGDLAAAVGGYAGALELFRGEPLAGLPGPFAEGERRRLTERRTALLQEKLDGQLRLGRHPEVIGELSALTSAHPYSEPLAALLMRALHSSGRRADALGAFARLRHRLADDLGVEPSDVAHRAHQAVLRGDV